MHRQQLTVPDLDTYRQEAQVIAYRSRYQANQYTWFEHVAFWNLSCVLSSLLSRDTDAVVLPQLKAFQAATQLDRPICQYKHEQP